MTTRKLTAETTGPVTIDATLLGHGGLVTVRAEENCEQATITISTTDDEGPAAEAVRAADLRGSGTTLYAKVQGKGGGGSTTVITGGRGTTIVQSTGTVTGTMVGAVIDGNVVGGDMFINGARVSGGGVVINGVQVNSGGTTIVQGTAPIEISAVVPVGSSVVGHTEAAGVEAKGTLMNVTADTQSGSVTVPDHVNRVTATTQSGGISVNRAAEIQAKTMSGAIRLVTTDMVDANTMSGSISIRDFGGTARLKTMSGSINVHAVVGGDIDAHTMSGDIDVTALQAALDQGLDVRPRTMSGRINIPQRMGAPRRRRY